MKYYIFKRRGMWRLHHHYSNEARDRHPPLYRSADYEKIIRFMEQHNIAFSLIRQARTGGNVNA